MMMITCMASSLSKKLTALLLILTVVFSSSVSARFVVEKSSIRVLHPQSLRSKHDSAIGNFGIPDYGGFMVGSVIYPDKGASGCQPFEGDKPFKSKFPRPTVLLLDRGGIFTVTVSLSLSLLKHFLINIVFFSVSQVFESRKNGLPEYNSFLLG